MTVGCCLPFPFLRFLLVVTTTFFLILPRYHHLQLAFYYRSVLPLFTFAAAARFTVTAGFGTVTYARTPTTDGWLPAHCYGSCPVLPPPVGCSTIAKLAVVILPCRNVGSFRDPSSSQNTVLYVLCVWLPLRHLLRREAAATAPAIRTAIPTGS